MTLAEIAAELERIADSEPDRALADAAAGAALILATALTLNPGEPPMTQKPRYYADLNPGYGVKYERRYVVWIRPGEGERPDAPRPMMTLYYQYDTLRACKQAANRLNEQDRRDQGEV